MGTDLDVHGWEPCTPCIPWTDLEVCDLFTVVEAPSVYISAIVTKASTTEHIETLACLCGLLYRDWRRSQLETIFLFALCCTNECLSQLFSASARRIKSCNLLITLVLVLVSPSMSCTLFCTLFKYRQFYPLRLVNVSSKCILFADDTNLFLSDTNQDTFVKRNLIWG